MALQVRNSLLLQSRLFPSSLIFLLTLIVVFLHNVNTFFQLTLIDIAKSLLLLS